MIKFITLQLNLKASRNAHSCTDLQCNDHDLSTSSPGSYLTYLHHQSPLQRNDNMLDHGFVGISVNVPHETRQVLERDEMRPRLAVDSIHCNICQFVMLCILGRSDTYCRTAHNAM